MGDVLFFYVSQVYFIYVQRGHAQILSFFELFYEHIKRS
jgi:hypothetical protein